MMYSTSSNGTPSSFAVYSGVAALLRCDGQPDLELLAQRHRLVSHRLPPRLSRISLYFRSPLPITFQRRIAAASIESFVSVHGILGLSCVSIRHLYVHFPHLKISADRSGYASHFALILLPHLGHGLILWNLTRLTSLKRRVQIHLFDTRTLL